MSGVGKAGQATLGTACGLCPACVAGSTRAQFCLEEQAARDDDLA